MAIVDGKIRCSICTDWKALAEYQPSTQVKGCGTCRPCKYQQKRGYETADREKYNAQVKRNRDKRRESIREKNREWLASDADRAKGYALAKYGITLDDYNRMLAEQGGGCAICGSETNKNGKALFVDHCHDTGRVRGILCYKCNTGLGSFKDDAGLLEKAFRYLNGS